LGENELRKVRLDLLSRAWTERMEEESRSTRSEGV
jgi:hypothetical protein